jgi:23S rRNA pseudouridine1911/1915/1917 synthase
MKWEIHSLQVDAKNSGMRLDMYLAEAVAGLSRTKAKKIIDLGGVHINGRRVRSCSLSLSAGDSVDVYIDHLPLDPYRITEDAIVFQDNALIVLNKPPQVDTQPTHARYKGTIYEALQWHLRDPFRLHKKADIGMVQRLDRGTSGLIVFSIHPRAHKAMTRIFLEHVAQKGYLALVHGAPEEPQGEIRSFLARSRKENRVKSVEKGGKEAITRYEVVEQLGDYSLLRVDILSGRSHQIRAHMAEQGCPLVGDVRYGGQKSVGALQVVRPLLHAASLGFPHPLTEQPLDFTLPLPGDMDKVLHQLRERQK